MTTLRTPRLLLRPFTADDAPAYRRIRSQPEIRHFLPGAMDPDHALCVFADHWAARGYGPWAVVDTSSGALIGHLGLRFLEAFGETELLWTLDRAYWGRGLASEAAIAARDWGFHGLRLPRLVAIALPWNLASLRVIEKTGLVFERMATFRDVEVRYYAQDRPAS